MRNIVVMASFIIAIIGFNDAFAQPAKIDDRKYPDILSVQVRPQGENHFDFDVTVSSPYDTTQRYADAFRVMSGENEFYGVRKLWHDHEDEQPFTRELYGVSIKACIKSVVIQGRDQKYGYGGKTVTVALPGR
jgi:hypothetical protein